MQDQAQGREIVFANWNCLSYLYTETSPEPNAPTIRSSGVGVGERQRWIERERKREMVNRDLQRMPQMGLISMSSAIFTKHRRPIHICTQTVIICWLSKKNNKKTLFPPNNVKLVDTILTAILKLSFFYESVHMCVRQDTGRHAAFQHCSQSSHRPGHILANNVSQQPEQELPLIVSSNRSHLH